MKDHYYYLHAANEVAKKAMAEGNTPFGAVLAGPDGEILLEQGNEAFTLHDETAHAELRLASRASQKYDKAFLKDCTLYTTCEPCPMCTGGIYWANIGHIVYGIAETQLLEMTGSDDKNPTFNMGADKVIASGQKDITLEGPVTEIGEEVAALHRGFWKK